MSSTIRRLALCAGIALAVIASSLLPAGVASGAGTRFVGAAGKDLTLGGKGFRFVGSNDYRLSSLHGGYTCGGALPDAEMGARLDQAKAAGATVVRTWFFQSYYQGSGQTWAAFDRVLTAAAARGLKVVPVLTNQWADCEFTAKDDAFYASGYRQPGYGYPMSYRDWARTVAQRYANNDTVAFWQLVNEAEIPAAACSGGSGILRAFADDVAGVVKLADPNHLVSLGTIGNGQCGALGDEYRYVHAGAIDICEVHDYGQPSVAMPGDKWNGMLLRITQCAGLNKPIFVGESGISSRVAVFGEAASVSPATLNLRADYFAAKMTAAFGAGVDGYLIWERMSGDRATMPGYGPADFGVGLNDPTDARMNLQARTLVGPPGRVSRTSLASTASSDSSAGRVSTAPAPAFLRLSRRTVRPGGRVLFTARLRTRISSGVTVLGTLQRRDHGRWRNFRHLRFRPGQSGLSRTEARFRRAPRGSVYRFRLRVARQDALGYATGVSRQRVLRVR